MPKGEPAWQRVVRRQRAIRRFTGWLVAASVVVLVGFSLVFLSSPSVPVVEGRVYTVYTLAFAKDAQATGEMVRSQRLDGSWESDYLTCQNAAALRSRTGEGVALAYKKALRYLHAKGLEPISDEEFFRREQQLAHLVVVN